MYRSSAPLLSFAAALIIPTVVSLQVSPGSSCSAICLDDPTGNPLDANASSTNVSDIVCSDVDYFTTGTGTKYRNCIDCLQKSTKVDGAESDVAWLLCKPSVSIAWPSECSLTLMDARQPTICGQCVHVRLPEACQERIIAM